jgi:hypothetical protein
MKITDPLKRRAEFVATSVIQSDAGLVISGSEPDEVVILAAAGSQITASAPILHQALVVEKIQLLGRPPWLTIDFEHGSEFSRIVADVGALDHSGLHTQLATITKKTSTAFVSRIRNET